MISFHVSCIPPTATHHHKRIVRVGKWTKLADRPELEAAKAMLDSLLLPHQPPEPIRGPVALRLEFTWPWLASHGKRLRAAHVAIPHTSKPDLDNASKTITDRLVALRFIEDDRKVVSLALEKFWGDDPGVYVEIQPVAIRNVTQTPSRTAAIAPRLDSTEGGAICVELASRMAPWGTSAVFVLKGDYGQGEQR